MFQLTVAYIGKHTCLLYMYIYTYIKDVLKSIQRDDWNVFEKWEILL